MLSCAGLRRREKIHPGYKDLSHADAGWPTPGALNCPVTDDSATWTPRVSVARRRPVPGGAGDSRRRGASTHTQDFRRSAAGAGDGRAGRALLRLEKTPALH